MLNTIGFYVTGRPLAAGQVIPPGNWGAIIQMLGSLHSNHARETAFEAERAANFPNKPSRLSANFVWANLHDAKWYRQQLHPADYIYEVRFDQTLPIHQGVFLLVNTPPGMTDSESIRHYWAFDRIVFWDQDPSYIPYELVTLSPLLIRDRIENF